MAQFNKGVDVRALTEGLTDALEISIIRVLAAHVGREQAISRVDLLEWVRTNPANMGVDDRRLRLAINDLRKKGLLICSTGGIGGGYWLAADHAEVLAFVEQELHPRAMGLLETERAMRESAAELFGEGIQRRML